jgi:hypothetical protein
MWLRYTPLKKSGSLSHQFIIAIPYKAIAAMRNLFKLCSEFEEIYFNVASIHPAKKSGSLSHQFIIVIPYKATAAMRNLSS